MSREAKMEITSEIMIPDLLRDHPEARPVLDAYGLRGCGGPFGPAETIGYFARAHGVDMSELTRRLSGAVGDPLSASSEASALSPVDELGDVIYRRFFRAALVVILTAGAAWGALLLIRIAVAHHFTAISIHDVNAHGHAQIFGWVGLFVMGFAYQAFPRMKHTSLWRPDLANFSFYLMLAGIAARVIGEPLFEVPMLRELAIAGGMAELAAIGIFVAVLLITFQQSGKPYERHDAYIVASLAFFLIQAAYDLGLLYASTTASSPKHLLYVVATFQAPLRDLQIHGFAMLMILGVGMRMFPALFGFRQPGWRLSWGCLAALLVGIAGESVGFVLMRSTGDHAWVALMYGGMVLLAGASILLTLRWGLLARPQEPDRSTKFIRAAIVWLHTSMVMLLLLPVYLRVILPEATSLSASGTQSLSIGFSHAYYGAVRHAITVGFISLTILGMAAKVVPTLSGVPVRRLGSLWIPFILVNLGCFMRVAFQIGTDFSEIAFPIAGASGLLEVTGIAVWGVQLWRIMNGRFADEVVAAARPERIAADHRVADVLAWFPQTLPVFIENGFAPLANPVLRRTMARAISIRAAAARHGIDLQEFLAKLNAGAQVTAVEGAAPSCDIRLPVLQGG